MGWMRGGYEVDAGCVRDGCGMGSRWMQDACGMDVGWVWGGCGVDVGWMRGGCGVGMGWMLAHSRAGAGGMPRGCWPTAACRPSFSPSPPQSREGRQDKRRHSSERHKHEWSIEKCDVRA